LTFIVITILLWREDMGAQKRNSKYSHIDTSKFVCLNKDCKAYIVEGKGNIVFAHYDGKNKDIMYVRCTICGRKFSENKGTLFYHKKIGRKKSMQMLHCISEGMGIQATARVFGVNKNTVVSLVKAGGKHCEMVEKKR